MRQVLSHTTRQPRPSELEGRNYFFISHEQFAKAQNNGFVEVIAFNGNYYGIKHTEIARMVDSPRPVYLVLNCQGAEALKKVYGHQVVRICIYADRDTLVKRQTERGDSEELIQRYMAHFEEEMAYKDACEHAVENVDLAHTVFDLS